MRLRKVTSRTRHEHEHTRERGFERYNMEFSRKVERDIYEQITTQQAIFLHKLSLRASVWLVTTNGQFATIVYDKKRRVIATVLPMDNRYVRRYNRLSRIERENHDRERESQISSQSHP
jgi:hypothetical protein